MSEFKGSVPIPKYDTGSVVAFAVTPADNPRHAEVVAVRIEWHGKQEPVISYNLRGETSWWEEEYIHHQMDKGTR